MSNINDIKEKLINNFYLKLNSIFTCSTTILGLNEKTSTNLINCFLKYNLQNQMNDNLFQKKNYYTHTRIFIPNYIRNNIRNNIQNNKNNEHQNVVIINCLMNNNIELDINSKINNMNIIIKNNIFKFHKNESEYIKRVCNIYMANHNTRLSKKQWDYNATINEQLYEKKVLYKKIYNYLYTKNLSNINLHNVYHIHLKTLNLFVSNNNINLTLNKKLNGNTYFFSRIELNTYKSNKRVDIIKLLESLNIDIHTLVDKLYESCKSEIQYINERKIIYKKK